MKTREEADDIRRAFIRNLGENADRVRIGDLIPCPEEGGFYFLFQSPEMPEPKKLLLQKFQ